MAYKFSWNHRAISRVKNNANSDTLSLAFAISGQAMRGAPVLTGALVNSIRVTDDHAGTIFVVAGGKVGGKNIPYAKKREYQNKAHPEKRFYMKKAFQWGQDNFQRYFQGVTK